MNEFFESKFMQDLKQGELPTVEVSFEMKSIIILCLFLLITGSVLIIGSKLMK